MKGICCNIRFNGFYPIFIVFFICAIYILGFNLQYVSASVLAKEFFVRKYKKQDILCTMYTVQPGVNLFELLQTRGEIAEQNFEKFLLILKAFNPKIKNFITVPPGRQILLPLKIIDPETLPDQTTGRVNIPFILIANKLKGTSISQYCNSYVVKQGDSLSKLIARLFGNSGTESYKSGLDLFIALNPNILDINHIYSGETICLPNPNMRLTQEAVTKDLLPIKKGVLQPSMEYSFFSLPFSNVFRNRFDLFLSEVANATNISLKADGVFYFQVPNKQAYTLDFSQVPVLELNDGKHILIDTANFLTPKDQLTISNTWEKSEFFKFDKDIFFNVLDALAENIPESTNHLNVKNQDFDIVVNSNWIFTTQSGQTCINFIDNKLNRTPDSIIRYLRYNKIFIKDFLSPENTFVETENTGKSAVPIIKIDFLPLRSYTERLANILKFEYRTDLKIVFPYGSFNIDVIFHQMQSDNGKKLLIDFGDIKGDAIPAISQKGYSILSVQQNDTPLDILKNILNKLNVSYEQNITITPTDHISITIKGIGVYNSKSKRYIFTTATLNPELIYYLAKQSIYIIKIDNNRQLKKK